MAFKLKVFDTADSANIQHIGTDRACAIKVIVFLSIDSAKMKRKQISLTTFLAEKVCQGKAIYV